MLHITALKANLVEIKTFADAVRRSLQDNSILGKVFEWRLLARLRHDIQHSHSTSLGKILRFQGLFPAESDAAAVNRFLCVNLEQEKIIDEVGVIPLDVEAGTLLVPATPSFPTFDFAVVTRAATADTAAEV